MTTIKAEKTDSAPTAGGEFEGEIREFIRRDVAPWRKWTSEAPADTPGESVNQLVQRVAGASMNEIDNVIVELQTLRETLRKEGERVQREIGAYASLSQAAMASMKIIADSMVQWRASAGQSPPLQPHPPQSPLPSSRD